MKWFSNGCAGHRENIALLASGVLPESERVEVEAHLAACAGCREYCAEIKSVAVPLANWGKNFERLELTQALQMRWAKEIKAAGEPKPMRQFPPHLVAGTLWRELFWSCRRIWTGFAAVWVVIVVVNMADSDQRDATLAKTSPPSQDFLMAMQQQNRLLNEILQPAELQLVTPPSPPRIPRPRSERKLVELIG